MSISSIFYKQLFHMNVFYSAFFYLQLSFVIFGQKNFSAKAARKMLVKLTTGVNFINILHKSFLYKSKLSSFSLIRFGFAIFLFQNIGEKVKRKMLMKLTDLTLSAFNHTECFTDLGKVNLSMVV